MRVTSSLGAGILVLPNVMKTVGVATGIAFFVFSGVIAWLAMKLLVGVAHFRSTRRLAIGWEEVGFAAYGKAGAAFTNAMMLIDCLGAAIFFNIIAAQCLVSCVPDFRTVASIRPFLPSSILNAQVCSTQ